jgi:uncharacterized membrane protein
MISPPSSRPLWAIRSRFLVLAISLLASPLAFAAPQQRDNEQDTFDKEIRFIQRVKPRAAAPKAVVPKPAVAIGASTSKISRVTGGSLRPIQVPAGQCVRISPTLSLSGGTGTVAPGGTATYTVSLKNNDPSSCSASTFTIVGVQPNMPGWTRVVAQPTISVAPGATATTQYRVTSSTTASAGAYQVYASVGDGQSNHYAAAQSVHNIGSAPPVCARTAPTLTTSGGGSAVPAGTAVPFTITVRNNDTAACAATNFSVARSAPAGWNTSLSANTLNIASGASRTVTLTATSPSGASAGSYAINTSTSSSVGAVHSRSVASTYIVQAPTPACVRNTPELTVDAGGAAVAAGTAKTYTVRLTNRDSASCASSAFSLSRSVPAGWTSTLSPTSGTLTPGAALTAQLVATSPSSATAGAYPIGLGAASGISQHTVNASTSYTVATPACTRSAPFLTVSGSTAAVAAGTSVPYTLQVTNRDSASCGATNFALSRSIPSGWISTLAPGSLSLTPGQTASATLNVSSSSSASAAPYTIGVGVGSTEVQHSATGTIVYTVSETAPVCTRAAPQVSITGGTGSVPAGTAVSYTVQVRNQDSAACAATTFAVSRFVPSGWTGILDLTSLTIAPGQSASSGLSVISAASAADGSYNIGAGVASSESVHTAGAASVYLVGTPPPQGTSLYKVDINFVNRSTPAYTAFKAYVDAAVAGNVAYGFSAYDAAYMYLLDPQTRYCTLAVNRVEADVAAAESNIAAGRNPALAGDSYLEVGDYIGAMAMTMHACPQLITASQKTRWGALAEQAVWNVWNHQNARWGDRSAPWSGWSVNNPGNNYQYSFLEATMSWALISGNASWISFLQTQKLPPLKAYFAALPGGGSLEGTGYGTAHMRLFTVYKLWKDSTGEDLANFSSHATDTIPYWVHATVPTLDRFAGFGDQSRVSEPTLYDYQRRVVIQARQLSNSPLAQALAAWWLNNISIRQMSSSFNRRYDLLGAGDPTTPAPAQLQYHATGVGQIFARTDWTPNAMWVAFIAGTYNESHAHQEQGGFTLFSQQDWQAVSENIWTHSGIQQGTETNNVLRFERSGAIIPQREGSSKPTLSYTPGAGGAFSATANVTPIYAGNTAVSNWTRKVDFVGRKLTVTDNFALGSNTTATFQVNTPTQPTVSGNVITAGGIQIRVLSPANPTITLKNWSAQDAAEFKEGWRVDIGGSSSQYVVEILDR